MKIKNKKKLVNLFFFFGHYKLKFTFLKLKK